MSSIATTIEEILKHPYWKNEDEREIYLFEFAIHLYEETCKQCAITYRNNRKFTPTECYTSIKDMPPPALNFWMKRAELECVVVPMMVVSHNKKAARFFNPLQLIIEFPEYTSIEVLQA